MAQSMIAYPVFLVIGDVKLKFQTKDGGRHLTFVEPAELPAGVSKEGFERVFGKLLSMARAETVRIEKDKIESAELARQAKEDESKRLHTEKQERARQARSEAFRKSDEHPLSLAEAQKKFPGTPFKVRAGSHHGASIAAKGALKFLFAVSEPKAGTYDKFYWFDAGERSVDSICPRCAGDLHLAATGHGYAIVSCNTETCSFRERRERPVERVKSVMNPAAFSLVG